MTGNLQMLLDHFHRPLADLGWKGFHHQWAAILAAELNTRLPPGWRAQAEIEFGVEVDVGVVEAKGQADSADQTTLQESWIPPSPMMTIPFIPPPDIVEVQIINRSYSPSLVGAIELVSPANKDRPDHRGAFVSKCLSILADGAGLIVVDIVTERKSNLHEMLMQRLDHELPQPQPSLYATAYHSFRMKDSSRKTKLAIWNEPLEIGSELPVLPLYLRVGPMIPVDLNKTYQLACEQLRISVGHPIHS